MDIKFNSKEIRKKLIDNFSILLWLFVFFTMAIEATVIKESYDIFTNLQRVSDRLQGKNLRINFEFYEKLEERLQANISYKPEPFIYISPFGLTTVDAPAELIRKAQEEEAAKKALEEEAARIVEEEAQQQAAEEEAKQQAEAESEPEVPEEPVEEAPVEAPPAP